MAERWLPVVGYEGLYEVSDLGRVRGLDRTVMARNRWDQIAPRRYPGRVLRQYVNQGTHGYPFVGLSRQGVITNHPVHILVLTAHAGPCPDGMEARHGPGGKTDARLANLCWGTRSQNVGEDRLRDGQHNRGERNGQHILTAPQVQEIRRALRCETQRSIATRYGVHFSTVNMIATGKTWRHLQ